MECPIAPGSTRVARKPDQQEVTDGQFVTKTESLVPGTVDSDVEWSVTFSVCLFVCWYKTQKS